MPTRPLNKGQLEALKVECPKCEQPAGKRCKTVKGLHALLGSPKLTSPPHKDRVDAALAKKNVERTRKGKRTLRESK